MTNYGAIALAKLSFYLHNQFLVNFYEVFFIEDKSVILYIPFLCYIYLGSRIVRIIPYL